MILRLSAASLCCESNNRRIIIKLFPFSHRSSSHGLGTFRLQACRGVHKDHRGGTTQKSLKHPDRFPVKSPSPPAPNTAPPPGSAKPSTTTVWSQVVLWIRGLDLRRRLFGEGSVPYGAKRIMRMKALDGQPVTADLVYSFSKQSLVRFCGTGTGIIFVLITLTFVWWYFKSRWQLERTALPPYWPENRADEIGDVYRPAMFNTKEQYAFAYLFSACLTLAVGVITRRLPLRIYYDSIHEVFAIVHLNAFGRNVITLVKPGRVRLARESSFFGSFFGDTEILNDQGKAVQKLRINSGGFTMPYYYNLMVGSFTGAEGDFDSESDQSPFEGYFPERPVSVVEPLSPNADLAERVAQRNAEKLEALRRLTNNKMS
ncbi:hypothetical protein BV898_17271 [Hypsibius exemplaris]|uniref:Uncharacterized protein n=1 Tax=Hypsibius exemplaris TaxID=2072580 RepID=A0A9X6NGK0_HYPEX|nr:hypothetical protein BV898_17271 [Hypsibius exemplaris]